MNNPHGRNFCHLISVLWPLLWGPFGTSLLRVYGTLSLLPDEPLYADYAALAAPVSRKVRAARVLIYELVCLAKRLRAPEPGSPSSISIVHLVDLLIAAPSTFGTGTAVLGLASALECCQMYDPKDSHIAFLELVQQAEALLPGSSESSVARNFLMLLEDSGLCTCGSLHQGLECFLATFQIDMCASTIGDADDGSFDEKIGMSVSRPDDVSPCNECGKPVRMQRALGLSPAVLSFAVNYLNLRPEQRLAFVSSIDSVIEPR